MAEEEKQRKNNTMIIAVVVIAIPLIAFNALYFGGFLKGPAVYQYKDAYLIGNEDPVAEMKALVESSSDVILIGEGDIDRTQKTKYIAMAMAQIGVYFGGPKNFTVYGIAIDENGSPVNCDTYTVEYCQGITPKEGQLLIKLKYPGYERNEVIVNGRTIEFRATTSEYLLSEVYFFNDLILK